MNTAPNRRASDNASSPPGTSPTRRFSDMLKESSGLQPDVKRIFVSYDEASETIEVDPEPLTIDGVVLKRSIACLNSPESSDVNTFTGSDSLTGKPMLIPLNGLPQTVDPNNFKNSVREIPDVLYGYSVNDFTTPDMHRLTELHIFNRYPLTPEQIARVSLGNPYLQSVASMIEAIYGSTENRVTYISGDAVIAVKKENDDDGPIK